MRRRLAIGVLLVALAPLVAAVLPLQGCGPGGAPGRQGVVPGIDKVRVTAFYTPWAGETAASLAPKLGRIETVTGFWFGIAADGSIIGRVEPEVARSVRRAGKRLVGMANNLDGTDVPLRDARVRRRAVRGLVKMMDRERLDGINVDFQLIPPGDRAGYTAFIKQLRRELGSRRKTLEVSVFPPVEVPYEVNGAYDYRAIGRLVDRVVIMTYDRHYPTGVPGPIAPVDWVERNLRAALRTVPRSKLFLGVALYGYDWPVGSGGRGEDIGAADAIARAARTKAAVRWDDAAQEPYYRYYDAFGRRHDVWFESADATVRKFALARKYRIGGVALWRLGFEEGRLWQLIK